MEGTSSLSRALAALEGDIQASGAYSGIGLIVSSGDSLATFHTRMRATASASTLGHADIPLALRPPIAAPVVLSPLSEHLSSDRAADRIFAVWNIQAMIAVPIESGGIFWAGMPGARPFGASDVDAVRAWADRLVLASCEVETAAERDARLSRLDAI